MVVYENFLIVVWTENFIEILQYEKKQIYGPVILIITRVKTMNH